MLLGISIILISFTFKIKKMSLKFVFTLLFFTISSALIAQKKTDTSYFMNNYRQGDKYFRENPDSAIFYYKKAEEWLLKNSWFDSSIDATTMLSNMGRTYRVVGNPLSSQQTLQKALNNARKYNHNSEFRLIFLRLTFLHKEIINKNWAFNYPPVNETKTEEVYFPISKIEPLGKDSLEITVAAGKLDGIINDSQTCRINSRLIEGDTLEHKSVKTFVSVNFTKVENNFSKIHVAKSFTNKILPKDFLVCYAEVPSSWDALHLKSLLLDNYNLASASDEYYNYRFFYYYGTKEIEDEILDAMLTESQEIAVKVAKDTLTNKSLGSPFEGGIFSGFNLIKSLIESKIEHVKMFIAYTSLYPANNMGNSPDFTNRFSSWIMTKSPLHPEFIENYFYSVSKNKSYLKTQAINLYPQIKENSLITKWIGKVLLAINDERYEIVLPLANLINSIVTENKDSSNYGWYEYLMASYYRKQANTILANQYLSNAKKHFTENKNFEGSKWTETTEEKWKEPINISIGIQNGHTKIFITALSPNSNYFATGSADNNIIIWNKQTGKEVKTIYYHRGTITSLHYSPDGRYLVSAADDNTMVVWNAFNYTPLISYTTDGFVNAAKFSTDSKLLYVAEDSILSIVNPFVDTTMVVKKIKLHNGMINDFVFYNNNNNKIISCGTDGKVKCWNLLADTTYWERTKLGEVKNLAFSPNNRYLSSIKSNGECETYDLYLGESINDRKAYVSPGVINTSYASYFNVHSFSPDGKFVVYTVAKDSIRIFNLLDSYSRRYKVDVEPFTITQPLFTNDGQDLMVTNRGFNIKLFYFKNYDFENNYAISSRDIDFYNNQINKIQYSSSGNKLQYGTYIGNFGTIDLATGNNTFGNQNNDITFPSGNEFVIKNDSVVVLIYKSTNLIWYNKETDSLLVLKSVDDPYKIEGFTFTSSQDTLFYTTTEGMVYAFDVTKGKEYFSVKLNAANDINFTMQPYYNKYNTKLYLKVNSSYIVALNTKTGAIEDSIYVTTARCMEFSSKNIFVTTGLGRLRVFDYDSLLNIKTWQINGSESEALNIKLLPNEDKLLIQNSLLGICLYDIKKDEFIYSKQDHKFGSYSMSVRKDGKEFVTAGLDGTIHVYETETGNKKLTIRVPYKKDPIFIDSNNYYMASKSSLNTINTYYNDNVYPYDQFDAQLNRPDIILKGLGRADSNLIKSYYSAYKKRLKSQRLTDKPLGKQIHMPTIKFEDRYSLQTSTASNKLQLKVLCTDSLYKIQSVFVLVNNTPILGVNGNNIAHLKTNSYLQNVTIPLARGNNKVKVYCTNSNGVSSLKESFNVLSTFKDTLHNSYTYFVGIGVAKYKDSTRNLTYSVKDIRDLASDFKNNFKYIVIDTLINETVTKENILALNKKLRKTRPNDRVIVAVTGHGLLNDSLDFYYATYDVNFNKPDKRGLKYELLEALLDDVPAQEKVMFIDACHSGAFDKDEVLAVQRMNKNKNNSSVVKGIASRSSIILKTKKKSSTNSFELMQSAFSDLGGSNGTIIISAAGGMEFAYESPTWNNGVFTYSIREGIFNKMADTNYFGNKNGEVSIQELSVYVNKRVSELTNNKQRPTSRKESLEFNWIINY